MINQKVKLSPHGNFQVTKLLDTVAICEAQEDRYNWGNATEDKPAFIVYLGCQKEQVPEKIRYLNNALGCYWCEVRKPKYLKDFEVEIKVRDMTRYSTEERNGLDFLLWAENDYDYIELDEYNYYVSDYMPRY